MKLILFLRDWSEVWSLLIPLAIILVYKPKGAIVRPLIFYTILAFILNSLAVFTVEFYYLVPRSLMMYGNNIFYNLHSFVMVVFISWYIISVRPYNKPMLLKYLLGIYIAFVIINFLFWQTPMVLSTRHFTVGSIVLLIMCLFYFLSSIMEESQVNWLKHPSFIVCAGVCLYEAITFFIFLFIYPLYDAANEKELAFAMLMMRVYQAVFVAFCISLAIALYRTKKMQGRADLS